MKKKNIVLNPQHLADFHEEVWYLELISFTLFAAVGICVPFNTELSEHELVPV